jgi:hypothetical protein
MSDDQSLAKRCRYEAAEIREAAGLVRDERFRDQLLSIASDYEAYAESIEAEISGQNEGLDSSSTRVPPADQGPRTREDHDETQREEPRNCIRR